ncbi:hypothetical protein TNCV_169361 [Trichonephila clavipes]|nr:hypothetical protein TNCV_169361 [Trichonephila clavipes]
MGHVTRRGGCCWISRKGRRDASFNFALQSSSPSTWDPGVSVVCGNEKGAVEDGEQEQSMLYTLGVLGFVDSGWLQKGSRGV